ncbi:APC family permease [Arthrobacter sp. GN70]|uniref:APC family permease n=1 Tax=Arthrobacter terricola TaxID=2547396 RepID=A0A4R5K5J7_9MICC|nr:APC family permease [Arthrobacter sp. GN70]TDF88350.1 APC family permease [Arthrobacter terricola]
MLTFCISGGLVSHISSATCPPEESWYPVSVRVDRFIKPRSPVEGLSRRKLSFLPVFAQAVAGVAPAGAMSVIPALVFPGLVSGSAGPNLLMTFGTAMAVIVLVSLSLRPMAKRMAAVSGLYSYTAKGLGPVPAITAGWSAMFGYALVAMASLLVVGTYTTELFSNLGIPIANPGVLVVLIVLVSGGAATFLMVRGVHVSAWITLLMESLSIAVLAVLMIIYFVLNAPKLSFGSAVAWNGNFDSLAIGVVVAVSAFVGFESPTTLGGEAYKPFISVPRAITWTPILMGALCLLAVTAQDAALKEAPLNVTTSSTPLSGLFSQTSSAFAAALDLGIAASWFACSIASVNALVRILFCMGREGVAPRNVGRTHPVFRTPSTAILTVMPVIVLVPIVMIVSGASPTEGLVNLFILGAYGYLGSYILASASMPFFLRRIGEATFGNWVLGAVTSLALGAVFWTAASVSLRAGNLQTVIYVAMLLASVIYARMLHRRSPKRLDSVGVYDESRESDLFHGRPNP